MSYGHNSFQGSCIGDYIGTTIGDSNKGDTRSLDYSSYKGLLAGPWDLVTTCNWDYYPAYKWR